MYYYVIFNLKNSCLGQVESYAPKKFMFESSSCIGFLNEFSVKTSVFSKGMKHAAWQNSVFTVAVRLSLAPKDSLKMT